MKSFAFTKESMYIEDFESFYQQAEALYRSRPLETRYCIKYRNCDGILALKVTDDVKVGWVMSVHQSSSMHHGNRHGLSFA